MQIDLGNSTVILTDMGTIKEVQYMSKMNTKAHIKKLDKHRYMVEETGEIKEFKHIENRSGSVNSVRQTLKKLRYLINHNFRGKKNELFVTLTYKENMRDRERLYRDCDKFIKKMKYHYGNIDYINVVEPQARGAWHCHVLMRFNDVEKIYIPNKELYDHWGHGFVKVERLHQVDNIGAYLSAYLADIELNDDTLFLAYDTQKEIKTVIVDGKEKRFVKGGRLHYYPPGINLYRKSRGIKYPEREKMTYSRAKKRVGSHKPTFTKDMTIETANDSDNINILFEEYNSLRV